MEKQDILDEVSETTIDNLYLKIAEKKLESVKIQETINQAKEDLMKMEIGIEKKVLFDENYKNEGQRRTAILDLKLEDKEYQKQRKLISDLNVALGNKQIIIEALERKFGMYFR